MNLSRTTGIGEAINAQTGVVTPPGEPLPPIAIDSCPIHPDGHQYVTDRDWERNRCAHCGRPEPPLPELLGVEHR